MTPERLAELRHDIEDGFGCNNGASGELLVEVDRLRREAFDLEANVTIQRQRVARLAADLKNAYDNGYCSAVTGELLAAAGLIEPTTGNEP